MKIKLKQVQLREFITCNMKKVLLILLAFSLLNLPSFALIEDEFVMRTLDKNLKIKPYTPKLYLENRIPVRVRIKNDFTTKTNPKEGTYIEFETVGKVKSHPIGTTVRGRLETVSQNCMFGVPADVVIGNFEINGKPLSGEIAVQGANRTLWLRPCIFIGTAFGGAGMALSPIRGGHAKIKQKDVYTLYLDSGK